MQKEVPSGLIHAWILKRLGREEFLAEPGRTRGGKSGERLANGELQTRSSWVTLRSRVGIENVDAASIPKVQIFLSTFVNLPNSTTL